MKTSCSGSGLLRGATSIAVAVIVGGCVTQRIVWSPDGKRAAVLASDGLHLCDSNGRISRLLLPHATHAAWFRDSERIAVALSTSCTNWQSIQSALDRGQVAAIRSDALGLLSKLQREPRDQVLQAPTEDKQYLAQLIYLRDEGGEVARKALDGVKGMNDLNVPVVLVAVARAKENAVEVEPPLAEEIGEICDLRISPDGNAIAYTVESGSHPRLEIVGMTGNAGRQVVEPVAAAYPDWSADGHSLVYIATVGTNVGEEIKLGTVTRRRVLDGEGRVAIASSRDELAGLLFNDRSRVRCLRDGRILFASEEWRLPVTTNDVPQRQQLFALDPERQATLTSLVPRGTQDLLPPDLSYFEVSPDEKNVAVGGDKSRVAILNLSSGNVTVVQDNAGADLMSIPSWRSASELCYIAVFATNSTPERAEVALWKEGKSRAISKSWPEDVRKGMLE